MSEVLVTEHHLVDVGGARSVARGEGHLPHGVHERDDVVLSDIDVADGGCEEVFFCRHILYRISTSKASLARVLCEFNRAEIERWRSFALNRDDGRAIGFFDMR